MKAVPDRADSCILISATPSFYGGVMPEGDYVLVNCVNCHGYLLWLFYNVVQDVFVMIF